MFFGEFFVFVNDEKKSKLIKNDKKITTETTGGQLRGGTR